MRRLPAALAASLFFVAPLFGQTGEQARRAANPPAPVDTGPMRVEATGAFDTRIGHFTDMGDTRKTNFVVNARLIGNRVHEIVSLGIPIIDEMVDDQGTELMDPTSFTPMQRERTRRFDLPQAAKTQGFVNMRINAQTPPLRSAAAIATTRGYVWVVYGGEPEAIYVPHPMQYRGKYIEHPRLEELGIRLRMMLPSEAPEIQSDDRTFAIAIETGVDQIRNITVYDDWLRNTMTRDRVIAAEGDKQGYHVYRMASGRFTDDCELGIFVFPNVERAKIEFEWTNLELP